MNRKLSLPNALGAGLIALSLALAGCVANEVPEDTNNTSAPANDQDGDSITDTLDNCPLSANPNQLDADLNGIGDLCQNDLDADGVLEADVVVPDNCPSVPNGNQLDSDGDGIGDACEADFDQDNLIDDNDNCPTLANPDQLDINGNGIGDLCEGGNATPPLTACSVDGPQTFVPLSSPDASVLTGKAGAIDPVLLAPCADCTVTNPGNAIDSDPSSVATMTVPQAATGQLFLQVNAGQVVTAGSSIGFALARPKQTLSLAALQNVTIETYLGGSVQESVSPLLSPAATLVDTLNSADAKLLRFDASKNFDQVRISVNGLSPDTLNVFAACIGAPNLP